MASATNESAGAANKPLTGVPAVCDQPPTSPRPQDRDPHSAADTTLSEADPLLMGKGIPAPTDIKTPPIARRRMPSGGAGAKGGLTGTKQARSQKYPKAVFFILGNEFCERFSFYGMRAILTLYFISEHNYSPSKASLIYHAFIAIAYFAPLLGSILADNYFGRFNVILYVSMVYVLGHGFLSLGAVPALGAAARTMFDFTGLLVIALSTGGIKPCVAAFAADQFPAGMRLQREQFFSFFYFAINAGSLLAILTTPILRGRVRCFGSQYCFPLAFGVPGVLMLVALVVFIAGWTTYHRQPVAEGNVVWQVVRCIVSALRRHIVARLSGRAPPAQPHPSVAEDLKQKGEEKNGDAQVEHTKEDTGGMHWLDVAREDYGDELVNGVRSMLAIVVLFLPVVFYWALFDQLGSTWVLQARRMTGRVGMVTVLPDQMQLSNAVFILMLVPVFETGIYPLVRRTGLAVTPLRKMGLGGMMAAASFVLAGLLQVGWMTDREGAVLPDQMQLSNAVFILMLVPVFETGVNLLVRRTGLAVTPLRKMCLGSMPSASFVLAGLLQVGWMTDRVGVATVLPDQMQLSNAVFILMLVPVFETGVNLLVRRTGLAVTPLRKMGLGSMPSASFVLAGLLQVGWMTGRVGVATVLPDQMQLSNAVFILMLVPVFETGVNLFVRRTGLAVTPLRKMCLCSMPSASFVLAGLLQVGWMTGRVGVATVLPDQMQLSNAVFILMLVPVFGTGVNLLVRRTGLAVTPLRKMCLGSMPSASFVLAGLLQVGWMMGRVGVATVLSDQMQLSNAVFILMLVPVFETGVNLLVRRTGLAVTPLRKMSLGSMPSASFVLAGLLQVGWMTGRVGVVTVLPDQMQLSNAVFILMLVPVFETGVNLFVRRTGLAVTPLRKMGLGSMPSASFVFAGLLQVGWMTDRVGVATVLSDQMQLSNAVFILMLVPVFETGVNLLVRRTGLAVTPLRKMGLGSMPSASFVLAGLLQVGWMTGRVGVVTVLPDQMQLSNAVFILMLVPVFETGVNLFVRRTGLAVTPLRKMCLGSMPSASFVLAGLLQVGWMTGRVGVATVLPDQMQLSNAVFILMLVPVFGTGVNLLVRRTGLAVTPLRKMCLGSMPSASFVLAGLLQVGWMTGRVGVATVLSDQMQLSNAVFILMLVPVFETGVNLLVRRTGLAVTPLRKMSLGSMPSASFVLAGLLQVGWMTGRVGVVTVLPDQMQLSNAVFILMLVPVFETGVNLFVRRTGLAVTPLRKMGLGSMPSASFVLAGLLQVGWMTDRVGVATVLSDQMQLSNAVFILMLVPVFETGVNLLVRRTGLAVTPLRKMGLGSMPSASFVLAGLLQVGWMTGRVGVATVLPDQMQLSNAVFILMLVPVFETGVNLLIRRTGLAVTPLRKMGLGSMPSASFVLAGLLQVGWMMGRVGVATVLPDQMQLSNAVFILMLVPVFETGVNLLVRRTGLAVTPLRKMGLGSMPSALFVLAGLLQVGWMTGRVGVATVLPDQMQLSNAVFILMLVPVFETGVNLLVRRTGLAVTPLRKMGLGSMPSASFVLAGLLQVGWMTGRVGVATVLPDQMQLSNAVFILMLVPVFEMGVYPLVRRTGMAVTPLRKMGLGGMMAAVSFVRAGLLQLKLNETMVTVPSAGKALLSMVDLTPSDCRGELVLQPEQVAQGADRGFFLTVRNTTRNQLITVPANRYQFVFSGKCRPAENTTDLIIKEQTGYFVVVFAKGDRVQPVVIEYELDKVANGNTKIHTVTSPFFDPLAGKGGGEYSLLADDGSGTVFSATLDPGQPTSLVVSPAIFSNELYRLTVVSTSALGRRVVEVTANFTAAAGAAHVLVVDVAVGNNNDEQNNNDDSYPGYDVTGGGGTTGKHQPPTAYQLMPLIGGNTVHLFWQIPQFLCMTIGEVLFSITGLEFSYSQAAPNMKSVLQAIWLMTVAFGNCIDMVISGSHLVSEPATEFFVYAALMASVMVLFIVLARRYTYVDPQPEHADTDGAHRRASSCRFPMGTYGGGRRHQQLQQAHANDDKNHHL